MLDSHYDQRGGFTHEFDTSRFVRRQTRIKLMLPDDCRFVTPVLDRINPFLFHGGH